MAFFPFFPYTASIPQRKDGTQKMTFGEKLAQLRRENNYTQEQLAEILQVSRQSISKWESGLSFPETDRLIKIGRLFSCSMDYLLNDDVTDRQPAARPVAAVAHSGITLHMNLPEKKSEKTVFGMPLYHIGRNAHGFFALGLKARGVFSLGVFSRGIFSFGAFSIGLLSGGAFSLGMISFGAFAAGILAFGAICLGLVAMGAVAAGCFSGGALAIGQYLAVGDTARGMIALGQTEALGSLYSHVGEGAAADSALIRALLNDHVPAWLRFARECFCTLFLP